jgi:ABC-type antimicrobial peptide transport system permease subunit
VSNVAAKSAVGRQSQLPFRRAFIISLNSLRIRFWRSIITAGGIFLGISFLTVVLTQRVMQWPVTEKIERAGYVRIGGQVTDPNDYMVWKRIPVQEGLAAGIQADVIDRVAPGRKTFQLARIAQGQINAKRADKKLARLKKEWKSLAKMKSKLAFYVSAALDNELKVKDAVKAGVPRKVARRLAREFSKKKGDTFKGSALADVVREQPTWIDSFHSSAILDQDISIREAVQAGVPETVAKRLAGDGSTIKAGPLNDAITAQPDLIKTWREIAERNAIYKKVDKAPIAKLAGRYAITLNEALAYAGMFAKDADKTNVMVVSKGRKYSGDFAESSAKAGAVKLKDGDNIMVPDRNSKYRMIWLVVMSLLVCTVGITNSMLMAVTERFKEIGTMKCLGALDKFVVMLFMLESGMMGIVASILGWAVGFTAIILLAGSTKGWDIVSNIEFIDVVKMFGASVGAGLLLTMIATIAPAVRAANMPPAMALRSEI